MIATTLSSASFLAGIQPLNHHLCLLLSTILVRQPSFRRRVQFSLQLFENYLNFLLANFSSELGKSVGCDARSDMIEEAREDEDRSSVDRVDQV